MLDQLQRLLPTQAPDLGFGEFLLLLVFSLIASLVVAYLYLVFYSSRATGSHVHLAFPLLAIAVTAIFLTIQFSLPLSLGLLGALSIVRFRTPIKEPEEIGFIMLVIAASLACATFKLMFVGLIFLVAIAALLIQSRGRAFRSALNDGVIVITLRDGAPEAGIGDVLRKRLTKARLESVSSSDGQTLLSYNFQGATETALMSLRQELAGTGVNYNIFFNRPGAL